MRLFRQNEEQYWFNQFVTVRCKDKVSKCRDSDFKVAMVTNTISPSIENGTNIIQMQKIHHINKGEMFVATAKLQQVNVADLSTHGNLVVNETTLNIEKEPIISGLPMSEWLFPQMLGLMMVEE